MKKIIKLKNNSAPFVNGFCDIYKNSTIFTIGESSAKDCFFEKDSKYPKKIVCNCAIVPVQLFDSSVSICAQHRKSYRTKEVVTMSFSLYDESCIDLAKFVSSVHIKLLDIVGNSTFQEIVNQYEESKIIYKKQFMIQEESKEVSVFLDKDLGQTNLIHIKSKAHYFAGLYSHEMSISDIAQQFFYIGTDTSNDEYIDIKSTKDCFADVDSEELEEIDRIHCATLTDDIYNGAIKFKTKNGLVYRSISASKPTFFSNIFQIEFKME